MPAAAPASGAIGRPGVVARPWTVVGPPDAPAIVFVHGTRLTRNQWWPQVRRLSGRYRCIALDLPGHGERGGRAVHDARGERRRHRRDRGRGAGGARRRRRAVARGLRRDRRRGTVSGARRGTRARGLLRGAGRARRGRCSGRSPGASTTSRRGRSRSRTAATSGSATGIASPTRSWPAGSGPPAAPQALRELAATRFVERLARLWTPVLIVNGALDPVFGPGGDPWAASCRRGRHVVLARAMHLANLDRPRAFSDLVAAVADDPAGAT